MRFTFEISSNQVVAGDISRSLKFMSDKSRAMAESLKQSGAENISVIIDPEKGFTLRGEADFPPPDDFFVKIKTAALR